jgi:hypothetical protein
MYQFTSVNNRFTIIGQPIDGEPEYIVNFNPVGSMGSYVTNDKDLAMKLREHPEFGKRFMEIGISAPENPRIVNGIRSSETRPELGEAKQDPNKLIEFGMLRATLLKKDGSYRKDASQEDVEKYELLKKELGV